MGRVVAHVSVLALAGLVALAGLAAPGCGDDPLTEPSTTSKPSREIRPTIDSLGIVPFSSKMLDFTLLDRNGQGVARRVLSFRIVDPAGNSPGGATAAAARGAMLSVDRAVTDVRGRVRLQVIAGEETFFLVRVTAQRAADLLVPVFVDSKKRGPVEVVPRIQAPLEISATISSVRIYFLTGSLCAGVPRARPMPGAIPPRVIDPGATSMFSTVSGEETHAIVAHGLDAAEVVKVDGCIDLPGSAVLPDDVPIRVPIPMQPLRSAVTGRFRAVTVVPLDKPPRAATAVISAWSQLTACPGDPGRLWLDCTVDALGPETADDPLDCVPSATDEAAFDGRLAARRGLPIPGQPESRCRQRTDGAGRASLETQIEGMFPAPGSQLLTDLQALPADVTNLLRSFRLQSTLELFATTRPDRFLADHTLDVLDLGETSPISQPLWELGLPLRTARFIPVSAEAGEISFERHAFTLRLGTAARLAMERGVLGRRGFPPETAAFVAALFGGARYSDRGTPLQGCAALSALVCPLVTGPTGCMTSACTAGGSALGRRLSRVFTGLDGPDLDLFLEGFAPIVDREGDGVADVFGSTRPTAPSGAWGGYLRTADEQHMIQGSFTADRER
jgi:hypothetical protein